MSLAASLVGEHAERHARLEAERLHALDHGADHVHVASLGRAPGRAHAVARRAFIARPPRLGQHLLDRHELGRGEAGFVVRGLAAIAAILGAAAGLDADEAALLDGVGVEVAAMHRSARERGDR